MRRGPKWSVTHSTVSDEVSNLLREFTELKSKLMTLKSWQEIDANTVIMPFLNVIYHNDTPGPVTGQALISVNKLLTYHIIDETMTGSADTMQCIADAVTHARFIGTETSSDEVVLMRILQVIRTLTIIPASSLLSDECICELIQSCLRLCFEPRLSQLLRRVAENTITDIVNLLFSSLDSITEHDDSNDAYDKISCSMYHDIKSDNRDYKFPTFSLKSKKYFLSNTDKSTNRAILHSSVSRRVSNEFSECCSEVSSDSQDEQLNSEVTCTSPFQAKSHSHGIVCVRESLAFMVTLINPLDANITEFMVSCGLSLLTVAVESGVEYISRLPSLLYIIQHHMTKYLYLLLGTNRFNVLSSTLRLSFLVFQSLRVHLKFQLCMFIERLMSLVLTENPKLLVDQKQLALDTLIQLWHIPAFISELYLSFDCDLHCPYLCEDLVRFFSQYSFTSHPLLSANMAALDCLTHIVNQIEIRNQYQRNHFDQSLDTKINDETTPLFSLDINLDVSNVNRLLANLNTIRYKKQLLFTGIGEFNEQSSAGIKYLQLNNILSSPINNIEIVHFLKESPGLNKKAIGDYISDRRNSEILQSFVESFDFAGLRIDESLRLYLESFRLPGEAPLISMMLERFAARWHASNGSPFDSDDAAFTLAYAIIMLNVDQHNTNVKKSTASMKAADFRRNLSGVNGGRDFDTEMLDSIYEAVRNDEIVLPSEQVGAVHDNYLWRVMLRRTDTQYLSCDGACIDHHLFTIIWRPYIEALQSILERNFDQSIVDNLLCGYRTCAKLASIFNHYEAMDFIILSLFKFTGFNYDNQNWNALNVQFAMHTKRQEVTRLLFSLVCEYGDSLRHSWQHVIQLLHCLYMCKLLPPIYFTCVDYLSSDGTLVLHRGVSASSSALISSSSSTATGLTLSSSHLSRSESSFLSSFYSYISSSTDTQNSRTENELLIKSQSLIQQFNTEQIIHKSKFLYMNSLNSLVDAIINVSIIAQDFTVSSNIFDEWSQCFFLEFVLNITIENKDRVLSLWQCVSEFVRKMLALCCLRNSLLLLDRCIVAVVRLSDHFICRHELNHHVFSLMYELALLPETLMSSAGRHVMWAVHALIVHRAECITSSSCWQILFCLLQYAGAGVQCKLDHFHYVRTGSVHSDDAREYTQQHTQSQQSDCGSIRNTAVTSSSSKLPDESLCLTSIDNLSSLSLGNDYDSSSGSWVVVNRLSELGAQKEQTDHSYRFHDRLAFCKLVEVLAFLIRDFTYINAVSFFYCVQCLRCCVEVNRSCSNKQEARSPPTPHSVSEHLLRTSHSDQSVTSSHGVDFPSSYQQTALQLLDLMHTLHVRSANILQQTVQDNPCDIPGSGAHHATSSIDETSLHSSSSWREAWCPLMQSISRFCSHQDAQVRMHAVSYLQRALLVYDLQCLSADDWESCFYSVFFPLLSSLFEVSSSCPGIEEIRIRIIMLISKTFLQHLTPLLTLTSFSSLWFRLLDFIECFVQTEDDSTYLNEAIPESLKNMLLVMETAGIFHTASGYTKLWAQTWDRIDKFLPFLRQELFKSLEITDCDMIYTDKTATKHQPENRIEASLDDLHQENEETCK